jgi:histidine triad (HIT) family protein
MSSIFSKIVAGDIPAYKVAETLDFLAFLDINPLQRGHVLVIPTKEVDEFFTLDEETYVGLMLFARIVAEGIKKAFPCNRIGMTVIGLEVPHAHLHLIPINTLSDMDFKSEKLALSEEQFGEDAEKIRAALTSDLPT